VNMKKLIISLYSLAFLSVGWSQEYRSIDGYGNNFANPNWGAVGAEMPRIAPADYSDGVSGPNGQNRPNPRDISNYLFNQEDNKFDETGLSDFIWVFGQFIDHDFALAFDDHNESAIISVPTGDPSFDPEGLGMAIIPMFRTMAAENTGTSRQRPREHFNSLTSFLDASAVYGSDLHRANWLRSFEDGKLKVSANNMLPWNTITGEFDAPVDPDAPDMADDTRLNSRLLVAGDLRANENSLLAAMHTLWVREHNRLCEEKLVQNPDLSDEELYQYSRRWVSALFQSVVYNEWLPTMGIKLEEYTGYDPFVDPTVFNEFTGAAFRLGHTMINSEIPRIDANGQSIAQGPIILKDDFFKPQNFLVIPTLDPLLRGMSVQVQQNMDNKVISDIRNFLFGEPGLGGLDLASININRGRERGLADYNSLRMSLAMNPVSSFEEINSDPEVYEALEHIYGNVNNIDLWVGLLSEEHMPNTMLGPTLVEILKLQFTNLRDGDRFFYLNDESFTPEEQEEITNTTMADIVKRNSGITVIPSNVFRAREFNDIVFEDVPVEEVNLAATVFPNPTTDLLAFSTYFDSAGDVDIIVYSPFGQIIHSGTKAVESGVNNFSLDILSNQVAGAYLLTIIKDGDKSSHTVIKQ